MDLESVRADIQSFADDDSAVVIENNGDIMFERNQQNYIAKLSKDGTTDAISVEYNGSKVLYKQFLKTIARLDIFAERIILKRKPLTVDFINGPGVLKQPYATEDGNLLNLLDKECNEISAFASKVIFVTADAGHGKTALLKEYQYLQAKKFSEGKSHFLFWHVDLQGRQLLRLSEALMGDLGELRISSLWMSSIITLVKRGLLVLAIDGFDELAAEIGSIDALGSLASLVSTMGNQGILVAASRRTFFDTEDYIVRSKMLRGKIAAECQFDEIRLKDWRQEDAIKYISNIHSNSVQFNKPQELYGEILSNLDENVNHPILVRPFLFTKLISGLIRYSTTPAEFMSGLRDNNRGLTSIVEAFIEREVQDKWRVQDTGEPYLTFAQHMMLLSTIAEEMWHSQKDFISIDSIQFFTTLLCEEWGIFDNKLKTQIVEMVSMHALLTTPSNGDYNLRSFDHPEFKDFFISVALSRVIKKFIAGGTPVQSKKFLSHSPLPDSVANYAALNFDYNEYNTLLILTSLQSLLSNEWKPTYLQLNIGTIIPFFINNYQGKEVLRIDAKVTFSSLAFENKTIRNINFTNGSFINTSFINTSMENVLFHKCVFSDAVFDSNKTFIDTEIKDCDINSIKILYTEDDIRQIFSPLSVKVALTSIRISLIIDDEDLEAIEPEIEKYNSDLRRALDKMLRVFRRTTSISLYHIENKFYKNQDVVNYTLLPLMLKHNILEERPSHMRGYVLNHSLENILKAEGSDEPSDLANFWREFETINAKSI